MSTCTSLTHFGGILHAITATFHEVKERRERIREQTREQKSCSGDGDMEQQNKDNDFGRAQLGGRHNQWQDNTSKKDSSIRQCAALSVALGRLMAPAGSAYKIRSDSPSTDGC